MVFHNQRLRLQAKAYFTLQYQLPINPVGAAYASWRIVGLKKVDNGDNMVYFLPVDTWNVKRQIKLSYKVGNPYPFHHH